MAKNKCFKHTVFSRVNCDVLGMLGNRSHVSTLQSHGRDLPVLGSGKAQKSLGVFFFFRWTTAIELEEYSIFRHIHMASSRAITFNGQNVLHLSCLAQQKHQLLRDAAAVSASAGRCGHRSSKAETWLLKWWSSMSGWPIAIDFLLIAITCHYSKGI